MSSVCLLLHKMSANKWISSIQKRKGYNVSSMGFGNGKMWLVSPQISAFLSLDNDIVTQRVHQRIR